MQRPQARWISLQGSQGGWTFDRTRSAPRTHASVNIGWVVGSCSLCRRPRRSPALARRKAGWAADYRWRADTDDHPTTHVGTKPARDTSSLRCRPTCHRTSHPEHLLRLYTCPQLRCCQTGRTRSNRTSAARSNEVGPWQRPARSRRRAPDRYPRPQRQTPTRFHGWGFGDEDPGDDLLSHGLSHTTIGAGAFHFRVRNGIGWFHTAMVTRERVEGRVLSACLSTDTDRFAPERKRGGCSEQWNVVTCHEAKVF